MIECTFLDCVSDILESLGVECLPYVVLLVIPVLGRMSDQTEAVRLMATHCFATLVRLMPLEVSQVQLKAKSLFFFYLFFSSLTLYPFIVVFSGYFLFPMALNCFGFLEEY